MLDAWRLFGLGEGEKDWAVGLRGCTWLLGRSARLSRCGFLESPGDCLDGFPQYGGWSGFGFPVVVHKAFWGVVAGRDVPVGVGGDGGLVSVGLPVPGDDGAPVGLPVDADGVIASYCVEQVVDPVLEVGEASGKVDDGQAHVVGVKDRVPPVAGGDEVAPAGRTGMVG